MRILIDLLLLVPALLYECSVSGFLQVAGVGLSVLAVVLAALSFVQGWELGVAAGLICGVILDSLFGHIGLCAFQYTFIGLFMGLAGQSLNPMKHTITPALLLFALCFVKEIVPAIYLFVIGGSVSWGYAALQLLMESLVTAVLFIPLLLLLRLLFRWDVLSAPVFRFHGKKW